MRVIAGAYKGRKLSAPAGTAARPTSDRLRESIFNILEHGLGCRVRGAHAADVFAGTGALGIEALSRGAESVVFIETARASLEAIRKNLRALDVPPERGKVLAVDARRLPASDRPLDIIFLDPPYGRGLAEPALQSLARNGWSGPETMIVLETARDEEAPAAGCRIVDDRRQGQSRILFLKTA